MQREADPPRRPFALLWYWLPGALLATAVAAVSLAAAALYGEFGWATLGVPLALGAFFGFGMRALPAIVAASAGVASLAAAIIALREVSLVGMFCALTLMGMATPLVIVGVGLGALLRRRMRASSWPWARFLPLVLVAALGGPGAALEAYLTPPNPITDVTTTAVVDAPPETVWSASLFADAEVAAPSLLTHVGLPAPRHNEGALRAVGDVKTVPLGKGCVRLRVTRSDAPRVLAYEVVEQTRFENRTARLVGGSMRLAPAPGGRTTVILTTSYEPLLGARAVWGVAERFVAAELQQHVLREVRRVVELRDAAPARPSDALGE